MANLPASIVGFENLNGINGTYVVRAWFRVPIIGEDSDGKIGYSVGVGTCLTEAYSRSLGEAIERISGYRRGDERTVAARVGMLVDGIDPNDVLLFSPAQIQDRLAQPEAGMSGSALDHPIEWVAVENLTGERVRFVPVDMTYFSPRGAKTAFVADSNGCSAGETLEEATVRAFLELVERDAVALWWYTKSKRPALSHACMTSGIVSEVCGELATRDRSFEVLDITTDLQIPAFVAVSLDSQGRRPLLGFGASFVALDAIRHAVLELAGLDAILRSAVVNRPHEAELWVSNTDSTNAPQLVSDGTERGIVDSETRTDYSVASCLAVARKHQFTLLRVDQSRQDLGLKVVRLFAPGLRSWGRRLKDGRLYDVPLALGWVPRRLAESELCGIDLPF